MGVRNWVSRHRLGVLVMVVLLLEGIHYLMTASWVPWEFN